MGARTQMSILTDRNPVSQPDLAEGIDNAVISKTTVISHRSVPWNLNMHRSPNGTLAPNLSAE